MTDKPCITYLQQIERMRRKGILIENEEIAKEVLESISYYGIVNGYKDIFGVHYDEGLQVERFDENISFSLIHTIFIIDQSLNNLLFKYIVYIEKSLKTKLSYKIAHKYSTEIDSYLNYNNYRSNGDLDRKSEINNIKRQIENNKNSAAIKHYRDNHDTIPPWVATSGIYFGTAINWYKICQEDIKKYIAEKFFKYLPISGDDTKEMLVSMMTLLQEYRNNIAHGNRTFLSNVNSELTKGILLSLFSEDVLNEEEYHRGIGQKDLFAVMISIATLINDPFVFRQLLYDFALLFNNDDFNLTHIYTPRGDLYDTLGVPKNFLDRLSKIYNIKFQKQ